LLLVKLPDERTKVLQQLQLVTPLVTVAKGHKPLPLDTTLVMEPKVLQQLPLADLRVSLVKALTQSLQVISLDRQTKAFQQLRLVTVRVRQPKEVQQLPLAISLVTLPKALTVS
tara:strand:- start:260 stop:601 length:342 start_codon:yes stop_codon:yes gene_type:complete